MQSYNRSLSNHSKRFKLILQKHGTQMDLHIFLSYYMIQHFSCMIRQIVNICWEYKRL